AAVHLYHGASERLVSPLLAYGWIFKGGLFVAVGDVNGNGVRDVIASADRGWLPFVSVFDGAGAYAGHAAQLAKFLAFPNTTRTGVRVAAQPTDGGSPGSVEKDSLFLTTGPLGGAVSRRLRQATFTGLTPVLIHRFFQNAK